jgi:transposase
MANQLKMAETQAILALYGRGWSRRRIARELGVHRETVGRYVDLAAQPSKPANAPPGSEALTGSKPAMAPPGSVHSQGPVSAAAPWRDVILQMLEQGLNARRICQDLVAEQGYTGSYWSIRRLVRRLGQNHPLPFRRIECAPGEEAQVDFGCGAPVVGSDGRRRRTHVLRVVLSYSRKAYSEVVLRQTTDDFIRCLENAFAHFGGLPRTLVIDNLRAAVSRADWFDPELNPKLISFAQHYGIAILPTKPYTPRHKGKVERGIDYVQENALKGRSFASLQEQNRYLLNWESTVADTRIHGTTRQQVGRMFAEQEKHALAPLPPDRFACFQEARRTVHRDGHVAVGKAYYSVPVEYVGREVWARWDGRVVRIFNHRLEQIALHVQHEAGRFSTHTEHIPPEKSSLLEKGSAWLLNKASNLGPHSGAWAEAMLQERGIEGVRVLMGLISLSGKHAGADIDRACEIALSHRAFRLRTLRELIVRQGQKQETFEFMDQHPIIRSLGEYGQIARSALTIHS